MPVGPLLVLAALASAGVPALAAPAEMPQIPCGGAAARPAYPPAGRRPLIETYHDVAATAWQVAACAGWPARDYRLLVALTALIAAPLSRDQILADLGRISSHREIRYWSVTDGSWEDLVRRAVALDSADPQRTRGDFTASELAAGPVHFVEDDNRSSTPVVYRMRLLENGPERIVVDVDNVSPIKAYLVTIFPAGSVHTLQVFEHRPDGDWSYYSLGGVIAGGLGAFVGGHDASFVNRAVALYRHAAHLPTDRDPPAMP